MFPRITLADYLMKQGRKVQGVTVYGMLKGAIIPPYPFNTITVEEDRTSFSIIDIVAIEHNGNFFWTHGEVLANIHGSVVDQASETATKRLAVKVSGGRLEVSHHGIVAFYKWRKSGNGWVAKNVFAERIVPQNNNPAIASILDVMLEGAKNKWQYPIPGDSSQYAPASNGYVFEYTEKWQFLQTLAVDTTSISETQEKLKQAQGNAMRGGAEVTTTSTPNNNSYQNEPPLPEPPPVSNGFQDDYEKPYNPMLEGASVPIGDTLPIKRVVSGFTPRHTSDIELTDTTKKKPDYHRPEALKFSKLMEEYQKGISKSIEVVEKYLEQVDEWTPTPYMESIISQVSAGLEKNWKNKYTGKSMETLLKGILLNMLEYGVFEEEEDEDEDIKLIAEDVNTAFKENSYSVPSYLMSKDYKRKGIKTAHERLHRYVYSNRVVIALRVLEPFLDLRTGAFSSLTRLIAKGHVDIDYYVGNNIYMLGLVAPKLTVEALDKIRLLFGVPMTDDMLKTRHAILVHSALLNENSDWVAGSTVHPRATVIANIQSGYAMNSYQYQNYSKTKCWIPVSKLEGLNALFDGHIVPEDFYLGDDLTVRKTKTATYLVERGIMPDKVLQDAIDVGVVVEYESAETGQKYIGDLALGIKEMYVYNKIYDMLKSAEKLELTEEQKQETIMEFQHKKDKELGLPLGTFQLEERQKQAIEMINHPVAIMTGGAGSGKTTTAEFLLFAILKYLDVPEEGIYFAAPTGKASQRLSEVVKAPASTIHRLFGLGVSSQYSLKENANMGREKEDVKLLMVDEFSIADINLAHSFLTRFPKTSYLYFLGDDDQLPPIGFGKPLSNLLTFLPVVHLNVSKRAAEGSKITVNANRIINPEDTSPLEVDDSCQIIDRKTQEEIMADLLTIIRYHIAEPNIPVETRGLPLVTTVGQGLTSDDIQIVTPYSTPNSIYGSSNLNKTLQDIFNPLKQGQTQLAVSSGYGENRYDVYFRRNDKVIHAKGNKAKARRFKHLGGGSFEMLTSTGVYNGDVGRLVGFYMLDNMSIETGDVQELETEDLSLLKAVEVAKNMADSGGQTPAMRIAIEYTGVNDGGEIEKYIILYSATVKAEDSFTKHIAPLDFSVVEHAWALTTHKLQGSQAKLVIMLAVSNRKGSSRPFVNRNMLYTMLTRAQKGAYIIGDVYGKDSTFNTGIRYQANSTITTLYDIM